jgi:hypothetical protein
MKEVIYTISPKETPFINGFSIGQMTIIRFSGNDEKVIKWFRSMNRMKKPRIKHEWATDELVA